MRSWQKEFLPWSNVFQGTHSLKHKEHGKRPDLGTPPSQARPIAPTHKSQIKDNHLQPCVRHAPAGPQVLSCPWPNRFIANEKSGFAAPSWLSVQSEQMEEPWELKVTAR